MTAFFQNTQTRIQKKDKKKVEVGDRRILSKRISLGPTEPIPAPNTAVYLARIIGVLIGTPGPLIQPQPKPLDSFLRFLQLQHALAHSLDAVDAAIPAADYIVML